MIRIGIVGSDNSHALAFSQLANVERAYGDEARVVAICGADPTRTREVADKGQIASIVSTPQDMLEHVDAAMVVYRHGDLHADNALPFLEAGVPTFVDKPFSISLDGARRMLSVASRTGALLTSFSSLRFCPDTIALTQAAAAAGPLRIGTFSGPCDFRSEYGGPFFYGTHTIEIALHLFGEAVRSVSTASHGGNVTATLRFDGGALVTLNLMGEAHYVFHGLVIGESGYAAAPISSTGAYQEGMSRFLEMIRSGSRPLGDAQMLNPIRILHAIVRSVATNGDAVEIAAVE